MEPIVQLNSQAKLSAHFILGELHNKGGPKVAFALGLPNQIIYSTKYSCDSVTVKNYPSPCGGG